MGGLVVTDAERRRVSICEALAGRTPLSCWDDCCQGLDSASALEMVRALRIATDLSDMTTIVKLSQGDEALYGLFDKVCIVGGGRMYYFGPADAARAYFVESGYRPLPRQTTFDFLVSGAPHLQNVNQTALTRFLKSRILMGALLCHLLQHPYPASQMTLCAPFIAARKVTTIG